jgi:Protein of unknown function (DUF2283)
VWISYDPEADAAYVRLTEKPLASARDSITCETPAYGSVISYRSPEVSLGAPVPECLQSDTLVLLVG